jgi:hypothetical protein
MKRWAGFLVTLLLVCLGGAWGITRIWPGADLARAVWISGGIAVVVQAVAFGVADRFIRTNFIAAWGAGSVIRLGAVTVYALGFLKPMALPATPALGSLAVFLLVTMFLEPVFLKR